MTTSFGGVCHIPALTFLGRLRLRSRFADGKLEATSNILLMESTSVFCQTEGCGCRTSYSSLLLRLKFECCMCSDFLLNFLPFSALLWERVYSLKAESYLKQLYPFICAVEHIGVPSHSIKYLLLICRGLLRFFLGWRKRRIKYFLAIVYLLGLWRSIWLCLSFECCWWLHRTAVCAMYRWIYRVRVKIAPCMETFFWLYAGVLEIFFYAGLLFSVFAAFVLRLSCSWSYLRRIVSFRYSVYFCR